MVDGRVAGAEDEARRLAAAQRRSPSSSTRSRSPDQLAVFIEAAKRRGEPLDHVLLAGPPGLGKTSLAHIIAAELGAPFVQTAGPALERKGDIAALPHRARARRRVLHRRDPPPQPRDRGDALPGDGGPPAAGRPRAGRRRADRDPRPAALHARRRDDPRRAADDAATRPLRRLPPPRALRRRASRARSCGAPRRSSASRSSPTASLRSPSARGARRGSPTACCAGCATSPRCAGPGVVTAEIAGRGARAARGRLGRARPPRPRDPRDDRREVRRRAGGALHARGGG